MAPLALPDRPFTLADLPELGISRRALRRMLTNGQIRRVVQGVYVSAHVPDTIETTAAAVALAVTSGHVVVDRTAALLHGIDTYTLAEHEVGIVVEACALRGRHPTEREDVDGRSRDLSGTDIMAIDGVRVTTPLRTALDLGCFLHRREAFAALCAFARQNGVSSAALLAELPRYRRRRGVIQLRELAVLVDPRFESAREAWTFLAIHDAGLPHPEPQLWIEIDGVPTYRLDLAYRHARVCVEYDGVDAHDRTPEQREHDRQRRQWLRDHGWIVIVVRVGDFSGDRLDRWLCELREALRPAYTARRW
jgi:hypothetical protein